MTVSTVSSHDPGTTRGYGPCYRLFCRFVHWSFVLSHAMNRALVQALLRTVICTGLRGLDPEHPGQTRGNGAKLPLPNAGVTGGGQRE